MVINWNLQRAKARLGELVRRAYCRLTGRRQSFVDFLLSGPPWPVDVLDAIDDRHRDAG